jgi:hypothetical protein
MLNTRRLFVCCDAVSTRPLIYCWAMTPPTDRYSALLRRTYLCICTRLINVTKEHMCSTHHCSRSMPNAHVLCQTRQTHDDAISFVMHTVSRSMLLTRSSLPRFRASHDLVGTGPATVRHEATPPCKASRPSPRSSTKTVTTCPRGTGPCTT